jgi:YidC/Oxa1 family membrane protein insertase
MIGFIFNDFFYKPLFNVLAALYNYLPGNDFGLAIIILTILIRFALYPLAAKAIKSQKAIAQLQPQLKEIQEKYKDNKEKQATASMEIYKKAGINPFSGFLSLLIQIPVMIALYRIFLKGLQPQEISATLYSFMPQIHSANHYFFGIIDLTKSASEKVGGLSLGEYNIIGIIIIILVGVSQYIQIKMAPSISPKGMAKKGNADFASMMQGQMLYFLPASSMLILWKLPSALAIYWLTTTVFSIVQQYVVLKNRKQ